MVRKTTDYLLDCSGLEEVPLYISLDGPMHDVRQSYQVLFDFYVKFVERSQSAGLINVQSKRVGCPINVVESIQNAFTIFKLDAVVHLEDDMLVSEDFMDLMRYMIHEFSEDHRVCTVDSGCEDPRGYPEERITFDPKFTTFGWGTWRDRWNRFYSYWLENGCYEKKTWSWDFVFDDFRVLEKAVRAHPEASRIQHIGWYGTNMLRSKANPARLERSCPNWTKKHDSVEKYEWFGSELDDAVNVARTQRIRGPDEKYSNSFRGSSS